MVSIVIPNYNYGKYIADCLDSCVGQKHVSEIIVVDDHSTDDSLEIIDQFPFATVVGQKENRGVAYCRNTGLRYSQTKYVVFLDADDMLVPKSIERRVKYLEAHPNIGMVYGRAKKINVDRKNYNWSYKRCMDDFRGLETYSREMNAQTLMWRRDIFEKYGGYYESLRSKEDKELLFRLGIHRASPLKPKIKVKKLKDYMAIYRRHPKAKHKRRIADKKWHKETEKTFDKRIRQLKREGITRENTWFPLPTLEK
jgi:glycosyltransferase involved in cell wall biosynthesis